MDSWSGGYRPEPGSGDKPVAQDADVFASPVIFPDELRVRYVSLNDAFGVQRLAWMHRVFHVFEEHQAHDGDSRYLSVADTDYDALVIGGNDVARVSRLIRQGQPLVNRKLKLSLMFGANPPRRAKAIAAGFDDVLDADRMHPIEAVARIRAMWRRYQVRFWHEKEAEERAGTIASLCRSSELTLKEQVIMEVLARQGGRTVPYIALRREVEMRHGPITQANLNVTICGLRKKLQPGVQIVAERQCGYRLLG